MSDAADDANDHKISTYSWAEPALYIMSAAGICASSFVIFSFALFPALRRRAFYLVLYLVVSDCGACLTIFLNFHRTSFNEQACVVQGFTQQFFTVASVLWPVIIAFNLFSAVVLRVGKSDGDRLGGVRWCVAAFLGSPMATHVFVWGGSLVSALIPLWSNSYGQAGEWCWIEDTSSHSASLRITDFYLVVWVAFLLSSLAYAFVHRALRRLVQVELEPSNANVFNSAGGATHHQRSVSNVAATAAAAAAALAAPLMRANSPATDDGDSTRSSPPPHHHHHHHHQEEEESLMRRVMRTLLFYPVVFFVAWLPSSSYRLAEMLYGSGVQHNRTVSSLFVALYAPAIQAILDAVVYGSTPAVRRHWAQAYLDLTASSSNQQNSSSRDRKATESEDNYYTPKCSRDGDVGAAGGFGVLGRGFQQVSSSPLHSVSSSSVASQESSWVHTVVNNGYERWFAPTVVTTEGERFSSLASSHSPFSSVDVNLKNNDSDNFSALLWKLSSTFASATASTANRRQQQQQQQQQRRQAGYDSEPAGYSSSKDDQGNDGEGIVYSGCTDDQQLSRESSRDSYLGLSDHDGTTAAVAFSPGARR